MNVQISYMAKNCEQITDEADRQVPASSPVSITVEVVYISETRQFLKSLQVPLDSTVMEVIELSGLMLEFPHLNLSSVGVYGKLVSLEAPLQAFDRVEIYRPLLVNPKEARRQRAKKNG